MSVTFLAVLMLCAGSLQAAEFILSDIFGDTHRLSDYRGKWVVVNYWATWCGPCLQEIPELEAFHARHKDTNAVVLGVAMEDIDLPTLREFVDEHFMSYPVLIGNAENESALGPIYGLPSTYFISPEGEVVSAQLGAVTGEFLEQSIRSGAVVLPVVGEERVKLPRWKFWERGAG